MPFEKLSDEIREKNIVVSASKLMQFAKSPKHYYSRYVLKESEQTEAMFEGELFHKLILEPDKFESKFAIMDNEENYISTVEEIKAAIVKTGEVPLKGKKADLIRQLLLIDPNSPIWDSYVERMKVSGKRLVKHEVYQRMKRIVEEVNKDPWIQQALDGGIVEQDAWYTIELSKDLLVYVTMKMDFFHPSMGKNNKLPVIIEAKKVRSAAFTDFRQSAARDNLYLQAAIYVDGIKAITGLDATLAWLAAEADAPYCHEIYPADFGLLEAGRNQYHKLIRDFVECHQQNYWPSYNRGKLINMSLPSWKFEQLDYDADREIEDEL